MTAVNAVHPIEAESYRILETRADLSRFDQRSGLVVARVIHASADLEYAQTMVVDDEAVASGIKALRAKAPVVCDVEMVRHGLARVQAECYLDDAEPEHRDLTRSAGGMRIAAERHPAGAIFVVGCAPTALMEVVRLAAEGALSPALVIGLPVGFVGAAESKQELRDSGLPAISNVGEKGGSAVAAAALNALVRMVETDGHG